MNLLINHKIKYMIIYFITHFTEKTMYIWFNFNIYYKVIDEFQGLPAVFFKYEIWPITMTYTLE